MGCNCRKAKKTYDLLTDNEGLTKSNSIKGYLSRIIQGLIFISILFIAIPFILLYMFVFYVKNGSFSIKIPKFFSKKL